MIVFWFLTIVAVLFVLLAVWQFRRSILQTPFEVSVQANRVDVVLREVRLSKPPRTEIRLYGDYHLALMRTDTGRSSEQTEQESLSKGKLVSLEFLDRYSPGSRFTAIEERDGSGSLNLESENRWFAIVGILFGAWMFGTFAWIVRPFATGAENSTSGMALKFLSFAALIVAVVVFVALLDKRENSRQEPLERVAVEAFSRTLSSQDFVADLRSAGVNVGDDVAQWLGENVSFCEYQYGGKTWRTTSLYCQPPEGQACPGRLNPDNPRDVKWGGEP